MEGVTDHKPLMLILGPKKEVPVLAAARLQRWSLVMTAYNYEIQFHSTDHHANADMLSRLESNNQMSVFNIQQLETLPVTPSESDPVLSKVLNYSKKGWPTVVEEVLKPYKSRENEITVQRECLLCGTRVIVPLKLRKQVLEELHRVIRECLV